MDRKLKFQAGFQPWMTIELKLVSVGFTAGGGYAARETQAGW